jgi:hypothetical protein
MTPNLDRSGIWHLYDGTVHTVHTVYSQHSYFNSQIYSFYSKIYMIKDITFRAKSVLLEIQFSQQNMLNERYSFYNKTCNQRYMAKYI